MPKFVIEYKTSYSFRELLAREGTDVLSHDAVDKAREWLAQGAVDNDYWYEYTVDLWTQALAQIGFTDAKIAFSGFCHQGSGASFTSGVDAEALIRFLAEPIAPSETIGTLPGTKDTEDFRAWVVSKAGTVDFDRKFSRLQPLRDWLHMRHSVVYHGYGAEFDANRTQVTAELSFGSNDVDRLERLVARLETAANDLRENLCHAIYRSLEQEYEWRMADAQLLLDADANGYDFDRTGSPI